MKRFLVFIVDDDELFCSLLEKQLQGRLKKLVSIHTFPDGESCLRHLNQKPNLIILDYELGAPAGKIMNGIEILDRVNSQTPAIPVVVVSGKGKTEIIVEAIRHGACDFIEKNAGTADKAQRMILHAIQYESLIGGLTKNNFWFRSKLATENMYTRIHSKNYLFFSPVTLPDGFNKKILPKKKRSSMSFSPVLT